MDTWQEIDSLGFYPTLVTRTLRRALGGVDPLAAVCQLDAAFDRATMFRHLTVAALTDAYLVQVHVDELEDGGAMVATAVSPVSRIRGVSIMEVISEPTREDGAGATEVTVAIDSGSQRRTEIEPLHCDDPECPADHGYSALSMPDDLSLRVSAAADGADALERAEQFVDALTAVMSKTHA